MTQLQEAEKEQRLGAHGVLSVYCPFDSLDKVITPPAALGAGKETGEREWARPRRRWRVVWRAWWVWRLTPPAAPFLPTQYVTAATS